MIYKIGKMWILANASFSKIGKVSDVPALKHILTNHALRVPPPPFGSVLHQLQSNISLIVCNLIRTVLE